jgi:hypothetical protein
MKWWAQRDFGESAKLALSKSALSQGIVAVCRKAEKQYKAIDEGKLVMMSVASVSTGARL